MQLAVTMMTLPALQAQRAAARPAVGGHLGVGSRKLLDCGPGSFCNCQWVFCETRAIVQSYNANCRPVISTSKGKTHICLHSA